MRDDWHYGHPDLLASKWDLHEQALMMESFGPTERGIPSEVDAKLEQAVDILNL